MRCGRRRPSTGYSTTATDDIFWCTADVGWITGHSYVVYGPLMNGATSVMFDGVPNYPDFGRFWETIDRLGVTIFYTAPTAIRALMREGDEPVKRYSRKSLRLLGTVGEPINPEAWEWYWRVVGDGRCPVVDTWWQTETGGILISPFPGATPMKPGSATKPLPGVKPLLVDAAAQGPRRRRPAAISASRPPGRARCAPSGAITRRFFETYFKTYPGLYFTGDGCRRDEDGYYWITGRVDDVINVSGHRIGTAEVESALVAHPLVAEAAVVGFPHEIKGQAIYAFVTLNAGEEGRRRAAQGARCSEVRNDIGALAAPEQNPVHAGPAQDPLRQDHAPHPAQDRRGRDVRLRRHLDARRPSGRRSSPRRRARVSKGHCLSACGNGRSR